ncbi:MAG: type II toxin-antitoxin system HicA family toxin [Clostridia bacterium]|nr:type II toxin-antitoxin system HicA family toxin [Clostridia bacterium]MBQ3896907.1 type II toxin-antitoxin system HicA family toxin [Clostridia bacterium]
MSQKEKLLKRVRSNPKDFTYQEFETLMKELDVVEVTRGKTSGSNRKFCFGESILVIHKPHPGNVLKAYQIKDLNVFLDSIFKEVQ